MARSPDAPRRWPVQRRVAAAGLLAALVLLGAAAAMLLADRGDRTPTGTAAVGGPFALTAADGRTVTDQELLGRPFLIFFGFTSCPDVCPTTLATVGTALEALTGHERIEALFVTLDPERDTPETAGQYAAAFHPGIIGLGGTRAQIDDAARAYRVYSARVPLEDSALGYTIDHSAFVYLMGADGTYRQHFSHAAAASEITQAVRAELER
ncbi:MAG: SCO family protein [Rhodospirillales bacterium]|nr:SCO family protein [Rhodospirillales bacterium]